jgi:hypothetical protein
MSKTLLILAVLLLANCGMKVVKPGEEKNDTKMVDWSSGKIISPYNCKLESMGNKFSALGKTEEDARKEVIAKCRDKAVVSFCKAENVTCAQNQ